LTPQTNAQTILNGSDLEKSFNDRVRSIVNTEKSSYKDARNMVAREYAEKYGLSYYEGKSGVFNRVYP